MRAVDEETPSSRQTKTPLSLVCDPAVLLLDVCTNLTHWVVFLRVLEYYHGILFLTTNQIADFDIAIPSRIHMAISYPSLKPSQMEGVFQNFLDVLDNRGLVEDYDGIKEWLSESVYDEKLDGRQIRNIVTTALSLARANYEHRGKPERLTKADLKSAFDNVKTFKRDFRDQLQSYKETQKNMIKMSN